MIEMVLPGIYKMDIPLPDNPLKSLNSYLIIGAGRHLLIDTGFNCQESYETMIHALGAIGVKLADLDLFITHLHSDHAGLVKHLATSAARVWIGEADANILQNPGGSHWQQFSDFLRLSGLCRMGMEDNLIYHPGYKYASEFFDRYVSINDGFEIVVGPYRLVAVKTPGHTSGHMCLHDKDRKLLIAGDHILGTITPNITLWGLGEDALGKYQDSLDRIAGLDIDLVLPGHRSLIDNCSARIAEIKAHHESRLAEVKMIVGEDSLYPAQVASRMHWDLDYPAWGDLPWGQKLFATGEAMAHLYHLVVKEELIFNWIEGILYFESV